MSRAIVAIRNTDRRVGTARRRSGPPWESRRAGYLPTPDWTALIMLCPGGVVPL